MKKFTKVLAVFCAMAMTVSLFSAAVFAAGEDNQDDQNISGEEQQEQEEQQDAEEEAQFQSKAIELPFAPANEIADNSQEQDPEPSRNSTSVILNQDYIDNNDGKMPVDEGSYVLDENINVSDTAWIKTSDVNVTIDLAGYTITYSGSGSMYIVGEVDGTNIKASNIVLTINDSEGDGLITVSSDYTGGGSVDHWINSTSAGTTSGRGGCILIQHNSKVVLNGGTIRGFRAQDEGGAIHANGAVFEMFGGTITGCYAGKGGGAISGNSSGDGTHNGSIFIYDGKIFGNKAENLGGGIRINRASLYLYGGSITNNTVVNGSGDNGGGGVQVLKGPHPQRLEIKGNVEIYDNHCTASPKRANLFFNQDTTFTLVGDLDPSAKIAFGEKKESTTAKFFNVGSGNYTYSLDSFVCDNSGYYPVESNGYIMIAASTEPSIAGYSLVVGGEIKLRVHVDAGTFANNNTFVSCDYEYTKPGGDVSTNIVLGFDENAGQDGAGNYLFDIPVESACMTAPLEITVNYGASGEVSDNTTVTIEQYAKHIINNSSVQKEKDVAEALLIYGGYAQIQFGINVDALPEINNIDFENDAANYGLTAAAYTLTDPDKAFAGAKLSLLSQTEIKLYFKKSVLGNTAPEMTVSYSSDPVTATTSGSYYIYVIKGPTGNGFSAADYDQSFTYSVGSASGSFSVETYLKLAKNSSTNQAMVNLAEAYYNFAEKCQAL